MEIPGQAPRSLDREVEIVPRPGNHDEPVGHSRPCQRGGQFLRLADRHQKITRAINQKSRRIAWPHLVHRRGRHVVAGHGRWWPAQELNHGSSPCPIAAAGRSSSQPAVEVLDQTAGSHNPIG